MNIGQAKVTALVTVGQTRMVHPKQMQNCYLHPIHRLGTVEEIVDALRYLESAHFVTGEVIHVDGGAHAGKW
jgi:NAD(P)-dependent dehydrogenase (short-subunit alcohol dehydrogenase family)